MKIGKVMIVDDDADVRAVTELSIRRVGGWDTVSVESGEEALSSASREQPDVILLDTRMPRLDGPATLERLRRDPATAWIPVIFLTAKVQPSDLDRYLELGAVGVIAKPFDAIELPEEIRRILGRGEGSAPDPDPELARLREEYRPRLLRDLARLEAELKEARRQPAEQGSRLEAARELAHRLKGTSGSYGLSGTSAALEAIESRLQELLVDEAAPTSDCWPEIDRALGDALRRAGSRTQS